MTTTTEHCGKPGGRDRHRRRGEKACGPCQQVKNAYAAKLYRQAWMRAQRRAMAELRGRHVAEYDEIFARRLREERAKDEAGGAR